MTIEAPIVAPTVAVGGVGGSGTRIVAMLLAELGLYLGGDLNDAYDNLWFTLLFKRRSILAASDAELAGLFDLFCARMSQGRIGADAAELLKSLVERPRLLHEREWLEERRRSFCAASLAVANGAWGWKEPNTHVIIDRLLAAAPQLRYVHVVRNALYMSLSRNQNQLRLWGPVLLDRDVELTPRDSLSYWCAAQQRAIATSLRFPGRVLFVDFDALCAKPAEAAATIARFIGVDPAGAEAWRARVEPQPRRAPTLQIGQFNASDLEYAALCGYAA